MNSISQTKISKKRITSQRQAVIKLIEKKDEDKRFIKNCRPISLLNVDYKIIPKVFSARLKKVLPLLISSQQTAYVANRCISESGRLISDLLDVTEKFIYLPIYSLCRWHNFFLKNFGLIKELPNAISLFSLFSGLKPNLSKCEVG